MQEYGVGIEGCIFGLPWVMGCYEGGVLYVMPYVGVWGGCSGVVPEG